MPKHISSDIRYKKTTDIIQRSMDGIRGLFRTRKTEKYNNGGIVDVIILAAGLSRRFGSETTKMLHDLKEVKILERVLKNVRDAGIPDTRIYIVIGHQGRDVRSVIGNSYHYVIQEEQLGTGHAVACCRGKVHGDQVAVMFGDKPLFRPETLREFFQAHALNKTSPITVSTVHVPEVTKYSEGYGTVIRNKRGRVVALERTTLTKECDAALYAFNGEWLWNNVDMIRKRVYREGSKGELGIPDLVRVAVEQGFEAHDFLVADWREAIGINNKDQFAQAEAVLSGEL